MNNTEYSIENDNVAPGFKRQSCPAAIVTISTRELTRWDSRRNSREYFLRRRANLIVPKDPVKVSPAPVKFARYLTGLKLKQLFRQQSKFAREASTAKHLLAKLSGFSKIRAGVVAAQDSALAALGQVTAEIKARKLACDGKLAAA